MGFLRVRADSFLHAVGSPFHSFVTTTHEVSFHCRRDVTTNRNCCNAHVVIDPGNMQLQYHNWKSLSCSGLTIYTCWLAEEERQM